MTLKSWTSFVIAAESTLIKYLSKILSVQQHIITFIFISESDRMKNIRFLMSSRLYSFSACQWKDDIEK